METAHFNFTDHQNYLIHVYKWLPPKNIKLRGVAQISHGMSEYAGRYERFARALTNAGFIVYANDHRGHGRTAKNYRDLGYAGEDGFNWIIKNMHQLTLFIKNEYPELPIFLFGHSLGAFLVQYYLSCYNDEVSGIILSGVANNPGIILKYAMLLAKKELHKDPLTRCYHLGKLTFGHYNKTIKASRTDFDWLSRDETEVNQYIDSSYCGFVPTAQFFYDFFNAVELYYNKEAFKKIPKTIPILFVSGANDPVGDFTKGVIKLIDLYKKIGLTRITCKFYPQARHEILNELNRNEVTNDILEWLYKQCK